MAKTGELGSVRGERCLRHSCPDSAAGMCAYVDRDDEECATTWCDTHLELVGTRGYCIRHASIVATLSTSPWAGHRPPVQNRAASLANWVGNDLDLRVVRALENVVDLDSREQVSADPIEYINEPEGVHVWRRRWRIRTALEDRVIVNVDVDEGRDWEIRFVADGHQLAVAVPPWVQHHKAREDVAPDVDRAERLAFYTTLNERLNFYIDQLRETRKRSRS